MIAVSRKALAAASLVAAVPAGFMCYLAFAALLRSAGDMKPLLLGVTGAATAVGLLIALLPIIILVGKGSKSATAKAAKTEKQKEKAAAVAGAQTAEIVVGDDEEASAAADEDAFDAGDSTEAIATDEPDATDDFRFEEDAFMEDDLLNAEPEPEPEPKKKKKKR
jgi:hypothetical protein